MAATFRHRGTTSGHESCMSQNCFPIRMNWNDNRVEA